MKCRENIMKIAYFLDANSVIGGTGNVLLEQAKIMSTLHDVVVVIPLDRSGIMNSEYMLRCKKADIRYVGLAYTTAFSIQYIDLVRAWNDVEKIEKWVRQERIDFLHSCQMNIAVELAARRIKIPHLMNIYQLRREEFIFNTMDILPRYHSCDSILYCSIWEEQLGVKTCCIRPSAMEKKIKKKERTVNEKLNVLMLGGLEKRKNQLTAIQAVECCNKKGAKIELTIIGDDTTEYAKECKEYVQRNQLKEIIFFTGFQSDIVPFLMSHDCYLCTSIDESFPSSIVESMTYDLTIISTPVAGVPELLAKGINAYVSSGYTTEEVTTIIMNCFFDYRKGKIDRIHDGAERLWKEHFSQEIVRKKLNTYYLDILEDYQNEKVKSKMDGISKQDILKVYDQLYVLSEEIPEVLERCYYYASLKEILKSGNVYIWGAGKYGKCAKEILQLFFPDISILAYIDRQRIGSYEDIPIIMPDKMKIKDIDYIFIGFAYGRKEVIDYLQQNGLVYNKEIFLLP